MSNLNSAGDAARTPGHYWLHLDGEWTVGHWIPDFGWELLGTEMIFDTDELETGAMLGDHIPQPPAIREGK